MIRPMLAATVKDVYKLKYPLAVSPKLDGIRALVTPLGLVSRTLKPIPNKYTGTLFSVSTLLGCDGELIYGSPTGNNVLHRTNSAVMSRDGEPSITYHIFDIYSDKEDYASRSFSLKELIRRAKGYDFSLPIKRVPSVILYEPEEVLEYEMDILSQGYEGIIMRSLDSLYKFGRSTLREQRLLKLKRFVDAEAKIVGFKEQMKNNNKAEKDNFGLTKRSSSKENKVGKDTLGALVCKIINGTFKGEYIDIDGFTQSMRDEIWNNQDKYMGKIVTFKYFPVGCKDKPLLPKFKSFREKIDL